MSYKGISYLELWRPFCSAESNHLCNFGRRHHEEQFCEIIEFGPVVQEEMSFKVILYLTLWWPLLQWSGTFCAILVEGILQEKQFCQIILIFDQWFRKRCCLKYFLSGLWRPLYSLEQNYLCNFGRGHYWKPSCEVILNLD